jgi:hypothetical protein
MQITAIATPASPPIQPAACSFAGSEWNPIKNKMRVRKAPPSAQMKPYSAHVFME